MARRIGQDLIVELNWETLLGVDKERREIRDLCARRAADHYVVFTDDFGLRTAGLVRREDAIGDWASSPCHALAGVLAGRSNGRPLVFLHALDALADDVVIVAIKAGRPEIDRVLPLSSALREAGRFIETLEEDCRLCGTHAVSGRTPEAMPLPDGPALSDTERSRYRVVRQARGLIRDVPAPRGRRAWTLAGLVIAVGAGAGMTTALWWRPRTPAASPVKKRADPLALHREQVAQATTRALAAPGTAHAARVVALLRDLPIEAARWRVIRMRCADDVCSVSWRRRPGGTLEALLDARPAAQPCDDDVEQAVELIELPAPAAPAALTLRKRDDFRRLAHSRAQRLRDAGLVVEFGPTTPLVAAPAGVPLPASVPAPAKGSWTMSGHLAFVDSVPGLLGRTGNMRLSELAVETDPTPSRFRAAGEFYVE